MKRRSLLAASVAAAALLAAPMTTANAQDFQNVDVPPTINVIVAYSAGGNTDVFVRTAAPYFEAAIEELSGKDTNLVIKNVPGAGGEVGWATMARAEPDGSTIGIINLPSIALIEAARDVPYKPFAEKFVPIGVDIIDPNIIRVNSQYSSLKEAVEDAKSDPGSVTLGADGPMSDDHLAVYAVEEAIEGKFTFIPYNGSAPASRAFLSEEIGVSMGNVTEYLQTQEATVDAAILAEERYEMIPDVATFKEKTGIEVVTGGSTRGWATVAGVPEDLLGLYQAAFEKFSQNPEWMEEARKRHLTLVRPRIGAEFGEIMTQATADVDRLLRFFKEGGYLE